MTKYNLPIDGSLSDIVEYYDELYLKVNKSNSGDVRFPTTGTTQGGFYYDTAGTYYDNGGEIGLLGLIAYGDPLNPLYNNPILSDYIIYDEQINKINNTKITTQAIAPASPSESDIWIDINSKKIKIREGTGWVETNAKNSDNLGGQPASYYQVASGYNATDVLNKIKTVDGSSSGLDADLLDGKHGSSYNQTIGTNSSINTSGATIVDNIYVTQGVITSMGTRTLTKSDLGLSNVINYGVATQAEAEGGLVDTKYMTPLKTKQAIEALGNINENLTEIFFSVEYYVESTANIVSGGSADALAICMTGYGDYFISSDKDGKIYELRENGLGAISLLYTYTIPSTWYITSMTAFSSNEVWLCNNELGRLYRTDGYNFSTVLQTISVAGARGVTNDGTYLYVNTGGYIRKINKTNGAVIKSVAVPLAGDLAYAYGYLWIADSDEMIKVDFDKGTYSIIKTEYIDGSGDVYSVCKPYGDTRLIPSLDMYGIFKMIYPVLGYVKS